MTVTDYSCRWLRPEVAASWRRSMDSGVAPEDESDPVVASADVIADARVQSPLAHYIGELQGLMISDGTADNHLVVVTDASGMILWIDGSRELRRRIDVIGMTEGAHWREQDVGTNAIGTALHNEQASVINADEHFVISHRDWLCAAEVIREPGTGKVVAAIDVTAPARQGPSIALAAVRTGARLVERLMWTSPHHSPGSIPDAFPELDLHLLGPGRPTAYGVPLTPRHAEILCLLVDHPNGLSADEIAYRLFGDDGKASTVRAEVHRIRRNIGHIVVGQPYQLATGVVSDIELVRSLTSAGNVAGAVAAYSDELLPRSESLEIELIRSELHQSVRSMILTTGGEAFAAWGESRVGRDDLDVMERRLQALTPDTAQRDVLVARRDRLVRRLAERPTGVAT